MRSFDQKNISLYGTDPAPSQRPSQHLKATIATALVALLAACGDGSANFSSQNGRTATDRQTTQDATAADKPVAAAGDADERRDQPTGPVQDSDLAATGNGQPAEMDATLISRDFVASVQHKGELVFRPDLGILEQRVTLANAYEPVERQWSQVDRPTVTKLFTQGTPGIQYSQIFTQAQHGILDLVLVIDNSQSMKEEQTNLSTKLEPLLEYVGTSDWRINVVTTSPKDGCSRAIIAKGDADPLAKFREAVNAGTAGDSNEQGIRMAVEALSCAATDWTRTGSTVAVLIVSDEDNCSNNGRGCSAPYNSPTYLTKHLTEVMGRKLGVDARVYGIYWKPDTTCKSGQSKGYQYESVITETGGAWGSICDSDYTPTLRTISQNVASLLKSQFLLSAVPTPGSVHVTVNGAEMATGWSVDNKTLTFTDVPPNGASIAVDYAAGATMMLSRFALGEAPAPGTLVVSVDGNVVPSGQISLDEATNELVFKNRPAASAAIVATFRRNQPLLDRFALDATPRAGSLSVKVDGNAVTAFSVQDGQLVLESVPADGAEITARMQRVSGPVLIYPVLLLGEGIHDVAIADDTGARIAGAHLEGHDLVIPASEHSEGREVVVRYKNSASGRVTVDLPEAPAGGSLVISADVDGCTEGNGLVFVPPRSVDVSCAFTSSDDVHLAYSYWSDVKTSFAIEGAGQGEGAWQVLVDGVETKAFSVSTATVKLDKAPPQGATVTVVYSTKGS
jgi:hypothetical protein